MIEKHFKLVATFVNDSGQRTPSKSIDAKKEDLAFVYATVQSELDELSKAIREANKKEIMDALIDVAYFTLYSSVMLGHKANNLTSKATYITTSYESLDSHCERIKDKFTYIEVLDIYQSCKALGDQIGNFDKSFEVVHKTNMAKYVDSQEVAIFSTYINKKEYKTDKCTFKLFKGKYVIFIPQEGKRRIVKPVGWQEPILEPFINL